MYRVRKQTIIAANNLSKPYGVKPGTRLEIPLDGTRRAVATAAWRVKPAKIAAAPNKSSKVVEISHLSPRPASPASARAKTKNSPPEIIPLDDPA
jgi:hypothetical protein